MSATDHPTSPASAPIEAPPLKTVEVDGLTVAYREAGSGPAVVLLHGWPTSSLLWRNVMPAVARGNRVIAPDLPGFGASDKPPGVRYGFDFFERAIDGLLERLGVDRVGLAVHDLGGPIGLHWALRNRDRVGALALLNTLVYPDFHPSVFEFIENCANPEKRDGFTSAESLTGLLRAGVGDPDRITPELAAAMVEPYATPGARRALADAGIGLELPGWHEIEQGLPGLEVPVRIVYGERDAFLPDVAETMARVARDLPQAQVTTLPDAGHFLQEDAPEEVGELLAAFFAAPAR